jgi:hypothetical protein
MIMGMLGILLVLENLNKGLGLFPEYMWIMQFTPLMILASIVFLCIDTYQRMQRPDISEEKRSELRFDLCVIIISVTLLVVITNL